MPGIGSQESVFSSARGRDAPEAPIRLPVENRGFVIFDAYGAVVAVTSKNNAPEIATALNATAQHDKLVKALTLLMAEVAHNAPDECWSTGPSTGDPIQDLIICPGCIALNNARAVLATAKGETP